MEEEEEGFDHMEEGGFLELLGSGGEQGGGYLFDAPSSLSSPSSSCYSSLTAAQMLCFGGKEEAGLAPHGATASVTATSTSATLTANKKPKTEASWASAGHGAIKVSVLQLFNWVQVRKEKLGDRITALQQLVSPFGKVSSINLLFFALLLLSFSFAVASSCCRCLSVLVFTNNKQQSYKVSVFFLVPFDLDRPTLCKIGSLIRPQSCTKQWATSASCMTKSRYIRVPSPLSLSR
ncbi:hypothetical protein GW17_00052816 [Ensete ventricosum]|nr:hypothetical protein GW17_00052816 [Ensete ventricosum]